VQRSKHSVVARRKPRSDVVRAFVRWQRTSNDVAALEAIGSISYCAKRTGSGKADTVRNKEGCRRPATAKGDSETYRTAYRMPPSKQQKPRLRIDLACRPQLRHNETAPGSRSSSPQRGVSCRHGEEAAVRTAEPARRLRGTSPRTCASPAIRATPSLPGRSALGELGPFCSPNPGSGLETQHPMGREEVTEQSRPRRPARPKIFSPPRRLGRSAASLRRGTAVTQGG
jgi:hypothetical protein